MTNQKPEKGSDVTFVMKTFQRDNGQGQSEGSYDAAKGAGEKPAVIGWKSV